MADREEKVRELAYLLWEHAGRPGGRDQEFWLAAEAQVVVTPIPEAKPSKGKSAKVKPPKDKSAKAKAKAEKARAKAAKAKPQKAMPAAQEPIAPPAPRTVAAPPPPPSVTSPSHRTLRRGLDWPKTSA